MNSTKSKLRSIAGTVTCLAMLLAVLGTASSRAQAATLTVTSNADSGPGSLREAIDIAANGDTILFDPAVTGTITLTTGEPNGQLVIAKDLTIIGPGARVLAIDGNANSRVFYIPLVVQDPFSDPIQIGPIVNISGLSIVNGLYDPLEALRFSPDIGPNAEGGGIFNAGVLTLTSCTIANNTAWAAEECEAWALGGGIFNIGRLTLDSCTIRDNKAFGSSGCCGCDGGVALGGGILNGGNLSLENCTFHSNRVFAGAASRPFGEGQAGLAFGGAVAGIAYTAAVIPSTRMLDCTVVGNYALGVSPIIAPGPPGRGGGIFAGPEFSVQNSIIAGNFGLWGETGVGSSDAAGQFFSTGFNLIGIGSPLDGWIPGLDYFGTSDSPLDPRLGPFADNGGATDTMALLAGSPAIDSGRRSASSDQRGHPSPYDNPNIPNGNSSDGSDIGAYEAQAFDLASVQRQIADPGQTVTVSVAPTTLGYGGVTATLDHSSGTQAASLSAAVYYGNPASGTLFDAGSSFTDLKVSGATSADSMAASFYYPSTVTGGAEASLMLLYYNGTVWAPVLSSGGVGPVKSTTDNLDGTVSGGRFTVVFDNTSTPKITQLTGTPFALAIDTTPPVITCPTDVLVSHDPGQCSAVVNYTATATDTSGTVNVVCTPRSGTQFPIGTTIVNCLATDAAGLTAPCAFSVTVTAGDKCPKSLGFWKNHPNLWPVDTLTLGSVSYTKAQSLAILSNPSSSDASVILAKQLIAALLNLANGSNPLPICTTIADANRLLDRCTVPCKVATRSSTGQAMLGDASVLDNYDTGSLTPACTP